MAPSQSRVLVESIEPRLHLDASQLGESIFSSTLATSASDESVTRGTIIVDVTNHSGVTQKVKGKVELLAGAAVLAVKNGVVSLTAGQSKVYKFVVAIGKGKLADGTYPLTAEVVQVGGVFSQSVSGGSLTVRPPIVALSVNEVFRKLPTTVAPGVKFSTTDIVSITNSGSDPSSDPIVISLSASTDDAVAGATVLRTLNKKLTINPGRTVSISIGIKATNGLPAGTYRLISAVTQKNGTVTSTSPTTAPTLDVPAPITVPEFVETILTATPLYTNQSSGAQTLSQIDVQMGIENQGTGASGSSQYALYVSTSPTFDSTATLITTLPLGQFVPGQDQTTNTQVDFAIPQPSPVAFNGGNYYIYVQVTDPDGGVSMGSLSTPVILNQ